jgi:bifunctional UDP-N-acetylglucosamine pyrophosphorylase / glucosamine-1-phosphate N-acetyltransferase
MLDIVILAAGKGTRMLSDLPKVLAPVGGRPLLSHVINTAAQLTEVPPTIIIGHGADKVRQQFPQGVNYVEQQQQLGTGHAVMQALPYVHDDATVLILCGDVPLISVKTLLSLVGQVNDETMALLTINLADPTGYGRILRDKNNNVIGIVEQKDATAEQSVIDEVNTGVIAARGRQLKRWLPMLKNDNAQREYYLTDIIAIANTDGIAIATEQASNSWEVQGINNRLQLANLEREYQRLKAEELMRKGVTLYDPQRFDCRGNITVGSDVVIDINCVFEGEVALGNRVTIGPNVIIRDSVIGDDSTVLANSMIDGARIASQCTIGPYARLRPETVLSKGAKIGNFVEIKKANIGNNSKVNHLSYIGDAELGDNVNVGAGTITCNFDGVNKWSTIVGNDVFIGSNSALVAPLTIKDGATVGAGATISRDVDERELVLTRVNQRHIKDWQRPKKKDTIKR